MRRATQPTNQPIEQRRMSWPFGRLAFVLLCWGLQLANLMYLLLAWPSLRLAHTHTHTHKITSLPDVLSWNFVSFFG